MNMGEKAVEFAKLNINNQDNSNALDRAYLVLGDAYYKISQYDSASIYLNYNRQIKKFPTEKQNVSLKHILT